MPLVYKSKSVEALDDFFGGSPRQRRRAHEYSRDLLAQFEGRPLSETTAQIERGKPGPDLKDAATHFHDHWLSGPLGGRHVDRVMRHTYREAIRLAGERHPPLPIETFWVAGGGTDFEMQICEGARAITVFVFIPDTPGGSDRAGARTWAIRPDPGHDPSAERLDDLDPPIVKRRVSGPPPGR